jgi:haloalkane dehalogenase
VIRSHAGIASITSLAFSCPVRILTMSTISLGKENPLSGSDFPYVSRYVEVRGSKMHYTELGSGNPILLLHGNPTNVYIWRNIIPRLAKRGRVVAVDLIGFGKSDKPNIEYRFVDHAAYLEGFIEKMGLRDITLVMHDWGSALGFDYAARHPSNVRGLVFFEALLAPLPSLDQWPNQSAAAAFRLYRTPEIGWKLIVNENSFVEKRLQEGVIRQLSEHEMDEYRKPFLDPNARKPIWRWPNELPIAGEPADVAAVQMRYLAWLQKTAIPKLLIFAYPGALMPEPIVKWARANLPNLQTVDIGPGIHNLQEDHPGEISQAIASWIERFVRNASVSR